MASDPARELHAEVLIDAPAQRVWDVLTDLGAMVEGSPELVMMVPLLPGGLRPGQQYLGLNRRKLVVWPTRNVVVEVAAERRLVWDTTTSGARWIYELEPDGDRTRLTARRPVPRKLTWVGSVVAERLLGGAEQHADELEAALGSTLDYIRRASERAGA